MQAGVHEKARPADTMARYPGATWVREFVAGKDGTPLPESTTEGELIAAVKAKIGPALAAGGRCMVSIKVDMVSVAKGRWTARLTALGEALTGLDVIVILYHEPENDMSAKVFAAGFKVGRKALKAGWAGLLVAYCAMAYQWRPGAMTASEMRAWSAIVADLYLVDAYSGVSFPATAILPEHPGWILWHTYMIVKHPGRRWGVGERGISAGPTRAATWEREGKWLATDPVGQTCEVVVVWVTGGTEGNPGWLLTDAASVAAVVAYIARITQPSEYAPGPVDGVVVHLPTGLLVAVDRRAEFEAFLEDL